MFTKSNSITLGIVHVRGIELVNFTALFTALAVLLPAIAHQFSLAGPTFLPMHLFVFTAALLFGWKAGLLVGIMTPIISFVTTGMPPMVVLPQIIVELAVYGFVAGFVRERMKLNTLWSLIIAMVTGRLALTVAVWFFTSVGFGSFAVLANVIKIGWPGMLIQIALVPVIVLWVGKYLHHRGFSE